MVPADEFDLAKSSMLSFFNKIEDSISSRVATIIRTSPYAVDLILGESSFTMKIAAYKRALAAFPDMSVEVERSSDFWSMIDDLRIARNAFAHGSQHIVMTSAGVAHTYAAPHSMRRGEFDRPISVSALPVAQRLAASVHLLLSSMVATDGRDPEFFETAFVNAKSKWVELKPQLPKGSSLKWPPKKLP